MTTSVGKPAFFCRLPISKRNYLPPACQHPVESPAKELQLVGAACKGGIGVLCFRFVQDNVHHGFIRPAETQAAVARIGEKGPAGAKPLLTCGIRSMPNTGTNSLR